MGLAQQRRQHRHHQQHQKPGDVHRERDAERDQGDQVLQCRQQHGEEPDPPHGLPPGPLQLIVDFGVLELLQVERRRMLHQLNAGAIGEEVAQETLQQRRHPAQPFADQGDRQLDPDQEAEPGPGDWPAAVVQVDRVDHPVHDELPDPEHRERHRRAGDAEQKNTDHVAGLGLPHHAKQLGQVPEGLEPLPPADVGGERGPASAVSSYNGVSEREGHAIKVSGER